jgi:hypothetical protein
MENVVIYFMPIWNILQPWAFGSFVAIWYIFLHFGILHQEKSGNHELADNCYNLHRVRIYNNFSNYTFLTIFYERKKFRSMWILMFHSKSPR